MKFISFVATIQSNLYCCLSVNEMSMSIQTSTRAVLVNNCGHACNYRNWNMCTNRQTNVAFEDKNMEFEAFSYLQEVSTRS